MLSFRQILKDDPSYALSAWELLLHPRACVADVLRPELLKDLGQAHALRHDRR
jgi:hypothetical protein